MPNCAVFGCNNTNRKTKGTGVKYYTFPKNNDLAQRWLQLCSRKDQVNLSHATICSQHFPEECFLTPLKHKLLQYSPKRFRDLKPDAVPTLKLHKSKDNVACSARHQRFKLKERKSLVREVMEKSVLESVQESEENVNISVINSVNNNQHEAIQLPDKWLEMETKLKMLEEENMKLKEDMQKLKALNNKIEVEKYSLFSQLKTINQPSEVEFQVRNILSQIFSPGQITVLMNRNKKIQWSSEDISCAISLRSVSAKAYRYLRTKLKYPLPALSSLRRWVSSFECSPGILKHVLLVMKHNGSNLNDFQKITALSFDEMSLSQQMCFERKYEKVFGPHKHVQVVMARGVTSKWKQPVYFDFDKPMKKDTLFDIINSVESAGFNVVSITSDMGGENRALWKELIISPTNTSFTNPYDVSRNVFVFADVPHMLKLARNHFVDKGFVVCGNEHITIACLEDLLNKQKCDLKVAFKLSKEHIYVKNKQNVKLAAQRFSNSTANALRFYGKKGFLSGNWKDTADILQLFNDWFDVCNSSLPYTSQNEKCAFGVNFELQQRILENMSIFVEDTRVFGSKHILPFQNGILLSNKSLLGLYEYLRQSYNVQYIITTKLNQDVLENFFSFIRSMGRTNDHPDALQFIYRMRWFVMGKHSTTMRSVKKNIESDTEECLTANERTSCTPNASELEEVCPTAKLLSQFLKNTDLETEDTEDYSLQLCSDNFVFNMKNDSDIMKCEGLRYLTGYVAFKLQEKYPDLGKKSSTVCENNHEFSWIETMSKGGLRIPSDEFFHCAKIIEESFVQFHGQTDMCRESGVIQKIKSMVYDKLQGLNIPDEAVTRLILVRTYIRMRHLNKFIFSRRDENQKKWSKKVQKFNH